MAVTDRDRAAIDRWIGAARQGGARPLVIAGPTMSGKTTVLEYVAEALGDAAAIVPPSVIMADRLLMQGVIPLVDDLCEQDGGRWAAITLIGMATVRRMPLALGWQGSFGPIPGRYAAEVVELAHVGDADDRFLTEAAAAECARGAGEDSPFRDAGTLSLQRGVRLTASVLGLQSAAGLVPRHGQSPAQRERN